KVRRELSAFSDEKTRESGLRFFREAVSLYGVKAQFVRQIAKENFVLVQERGKHEILILCDTLWKSGMMEESFIACEWAHRLNRKYQPEDFMIFEDWVQNYVNNWASCDTLCNHTIGDFIQMYPQYLSGLKKWALSDNRWMRRAAAVSLIIPARRGKFLPDIFEIANILLQDKDDMVQKGYGWMLKEASKPCRKEVFDFVMKNKAAMPRTALRYAIEKMPPELRSMAMAR
ncbi:MAG: DNA alkylation repair protein, partial [Bacteroidales bacterium]|nr:DNA alkylation repair protein [Bacteroidales bacterium]